MPPLSAQGLHLLGSTGFDNQYSIPRIQSLDAVVEVIGVAEMKDTISIRRLKRDHISVDDLPLRAYILGRVDRYGGSPCKSGELHGQDVILLGGTPLNRRTDFEYVRSVPLHAFNSIYDFIEKYEPPKRAAFRDILKV